MKLEYSKHRHEGYWALAKLITFVLIGTYFFSSPENQNKIFHYFTFFYLLSIEHLILSKK